MRHLSFLFALSVFVFSQTACIQHRELINFDEGPSFDSLQATVEHQALRIQYDDLLAITILSQTAETKATAPFQAAAAPGGTGVVEPQFLVDVNGEVNIPLAGKVPVVGLTTQQARDTVTKYLAPYLIKPIVNVKLSNFRFSVLGDVNKAGTYSVPYERVTILEALGLAGDLTKYGNRGNILVIRQTDGLRRYGRVNLHSRDVFLSPYFFVEQGDIIYVEPLKAKVGDTADGATKSLQWALPIVSALGLLVTLFTLQK